MYVQPQQNTHLQNQTPNPPQHNIGTQPPSQYQTYIPQQKHNIPQQQHNIPQQKHNVPQQQHSVPQQQHSIPPQKYTIPQQQQNHTLNTQHTHISPQGPHSIFYTHNMAQGPSYVEDPQYNAHNIVRKQGYNVSPYQKNTPSDDVTLKIQNLSQRISDIQIGKPKKSYSLRYICPYPFDLSLSMITFPKNFKIPKFDKYSGREDPIEYV